MSCLRRSFGNILCRREAISQLENMALSFLSQLTESFRLESMKQRGEVDEALGSLPKRGMKKVTLELANRRASLDGSVLQELLSRKCTEKSLGLQEHVLCGFLETSKHHVLEGRVNTLVATRSQGIEFRLSAAIKGR